MPGLDPGIHSATLNDNRDRDGRVKPGNHHKGSGASLKDAEDDRSEENESGADRYEIQRLDEGHEVASLCFTRRILARKRRI